MPEPRKGDWMQTFTGQAFWPLDPREDEIFAEDIAHALSMLCRYNGHCKTFYSVAEHCVLMSYAVSPENALAALLHDATEAYVTDVPRPLKPYLAEYAAIEHKVWLAICERFSISPELPDEVKQADHRILLTEKDAIMADPPKDWAIDGVPLSVHIQGWAPEEAKIQYLTRMFGLMTERLIDAAASC